VFYGSTVAVCAFLGAFPDVGTIAKLCVEAGFTQTDTATAPSNVSSAGEISLQLAPPSPDAYAPGAFWFWAAADNLRLSASNAVKLAERLLDQKPSE